MIEIITKTAMDIMLYVSCLLILAGSIALSFKTRFVQVRLIPLIFKMLKSSLSKKGQKEEANTILPHKALFTAMSTTLGIGTIVAPIIAISLGGPGSLLGFLLTSFFGSAATYTEVNLSLKYRKRTDTGIIMGGPMQYIKVLISPTAARLYAVFCFLLMIAWSGCQSNQLAAILDSPLLGDYRIPKIVTGTVVAAFVFVLLTGGIKRISSFSSKLVPAMFVLYLGSIVWIIVDNLHMLPAIFNEIFSTALTPYQLATGTVVGGALSALRWGIFKGIHANEAGIGTQTIPHSMVETKESETQATLAMLSTYTAGIVGFLSGIVALITRTWENPELPLGISMVAASFQLYFSEIGIAIVSFAVLLFGFGTILGNSYNGSQCFTFLTENRWLYAYFVGTTIIVFFGAIAEVTTFWAMTDIILATMALIHMSALLIAAFKPAPVSANVKA